MRPYFMWPLNQVEIDNIRSKYTEKSYLQNLNLKNKRVFFLYSWKKFILKYTSLKKYQIKNFTFILFARDIKVVTLKFIQIILKSNQIYLQNLIPLFCASFSEIQHYDFRNGMPPGENFWTRAVTVVNSVMTGESVALSVLWASLLCCWNRKWISKNDISLSQNWYYAPSYLIISMKISWNFLHWCKLGNR